MEETLEKEIRRIAGDYTLRKNMGLDDRRHDRIFRDEANAMLDLQKNHNVPTQTLALYFERDYRQVKKHLEKLREATICEDEIKSGEATRPRELSSIQQRKADLDQRHIDRMVAALDRIRDCLDDPYLEMEALHGIDPPLLLGGHDWALVPDIWVDLVIPDFGIEEPWGDDFPQLRQHLDDSPFWDHLKRLRKTAQILKKDLHAAATQLGKSDAKFQKEWEQFLFSCQFFLTQSRNPKYPEPNWDTIEPPCGYDFTQKVCRMLADGPMPDIYHRQRDLQLKLAQLNKDLSLNAIEPLIIESTCDYCKNFQ